MNVPQAGVPAVIPQFGFIIVDTTTRTIHDRHIFPTRDIPNRIAASREGLAPAAIAWRNP